MVGADQREGSRADPNGPFALRFHSAVEAPLPARLGREFLPTDKCEGTAGLKFLQ